MPPNLDQLVLEKDQREIGLDEFALARQRLADIFTPTRPLPRGASLVTYAPGTEPFVGRSVELERILRALAEDRAHVVIYGERGLGKTSLANLAVARLRMTNFEVVRHVCSASSNFDSIMRGLLLDLPRWYGASPGASPDADRGDRLTQRPLRPGDVFKLLQIPKGSRLVLVIDEFDRVTDEDTRTEIADTIKHCSDRSASFLFMIIGVSNSVEELLGRHPSIQRCVARIALPLLTPAEVEQIVLRGSAKAGLDFSPAARALIVNLARGVPYIAQLLSLRAGQEALSNRRFDIRGSDFIAAVAAAAAEADPRVANIYDSATDSGRDRATTGLLQAAALGPQDEFGRFRAGGAGRLLRVAGVPVTPAAWRRALETGAIRASPAGEPDLFIFGEAMLPHLVLQRAVLSRAAPGPFTHSAEMVRMTQQG